MLKQPKITSPIPLLAAGGNPSKKKISKTFVSTPMLEALYNGLPVRQDVATAREPSLRESLAEKLQTQFQRFMPEGSAKKTARKITGYSYPMGLVDVTPAGIPLWAYEGGESLAKAAQAAGKGEYGTAALEGLMGTLGVAPAAPAVASLGKAAGKGVAGQIERAMMTGEGPLGSALAAVRPQFAIAYHGSPHKFEKFDISKIGTGEGAQAYGHGLYFAEAPEVAESYKGFLSKKTAMDDPDYLRAVAKQSALAEQLSQKYGVSDLNTFRSMLEMGEADDIPKKYENALRQADKRVSDAYNAAVAKTGALYKVDIPDEAVARMLDWDKPLSEQPEILSRTGPHGKEFTFRDELKRLGLDSSVTGADLLQMGYGSGRSGQRAQEVSSYLNKWGIPGIKYLDEGSRAAGEGTRNFVLFSDELPRILEVNEKPTGALPWAPGEWGRPEFKYPQAEALETARKNAVTMLGLPEENTAMDRARAMGGVNVLHGTGSDIAKIDPSLSGTNTRAAGEELGFFTSSKPELAAHYAELAAKGGWHGRGQQGAANIMPLVVFPRNPKKYETASEFYREADKRAAAGQLGDWKKELQAQGYDSVQVRPDLEEMVMFNPSAIRSRFAAFDPARINEADLLGYAQPEILPYLAGVGALGGLGLAAIKDEQPKKGKKNGK